MILIYLIFLINSFIEVGSSVPDQVNLYLSNIENEVDEDLNFWALNELYVSHCGVNRSIERGIAQSDLIFIKQLFNQFPCQVSAHNDSSYHDRLKYYAIEKNSLQIAIFYLTQNDSEKEQSLFIDDWLKKNPDTNEVEFLNKLKNRTNVDYEEITNFSSFLPIYSVLYSDFSDLYIRQQDYIPLLEFVLEEKKLVQGDQSLNNSLLFYTTFILSYTLDQYQIIVSLFDDLTEENSYPMSVRKVRILNGLNYSLSTSGNFYESLFFQRNQLIPLANYYGQKTIVDNAKLQQSANLYNLGKYQEAKEILEELYNDPDTHVLRSQLYNNLSLCYARLGEKNKYTSFLLQAIQEAEANTTNDPSFYEIELGLYQNLFVYYNSIGDSSSALPFIKKAKDLAERNNNRIELGAIFYYLGAYYWDNYQDAERALEEFKKAESEFNEANSYLNTILLLMDKTYILADTESYEEAESVIAEIIDLSTSNSDNPRLIEALLLSAEISLRNKDIDRLKSLLDRIQVYTLDDLRFEILVKYQNLYTRLLIAHDKKREALDYFRPYLDQVIDWAQGTVDSQTGFWTVEDEYLDAFEIMIELLLDLGQEDEAIAYLDELKTINDASLYNNPILMGNKLSEKELAEQIQLGEDIQKLRNRYLSATANEKSSLKNEIDRLSALRQEITNKVVVNEIQERLPIWKIKQQLDSDEVVIHYTELNDKLYVSTLTNTSSAVNIMNLTAEDRDLLQRASLKLSSGQTSLDDLYAIFKRLDLEEIEKNVRQISVIPDNELFKIPLEVLPTEKPNSDKSFGSTTYMIENHTFKYFTSLDDFSRNNRSSSSSRNTGFSAFAISYFDDFEKKELPSLPFATIEAREIEQTLNSFDIKRIFSGNSATESAFLQQLSESKVIHVATHSEVSEQDPLFSTIYLKENNNGSIRGDALYAYELFESKLDNDLIMLNSCSSGSGNYMQGSGIMGISRALRYAGARSLALNLWEVNDKVASELATDFYNYINSGYSKSQAMRMAKINQLKGGSADPHFWGAYSLIGNSNPIIKKPANTRYALPLMLTLTLLVGYRIRKKTDY